MEPADDLVDSRSERARRDGARCTFPTADRFRKLLLDLGDGDPAAYLMSRSLLDDVSESADIRIWNRTCDPSFEAELQSRLLAHLSANGREHHGYPHLLEALASSNEPVRLLEITTAQFTGSGIVSIATGHLRSIAYSRKTKAMTLSTDEFQRMLRQSVESEAHQRACKPLLDELSEDSRITLHLTPMETSLVFRTYARHEQRLARSGLEHGGFEESIATQAALDREVWSLFVDTQRFHGVGAVSVRTGHLITLMYAEQRRPRGVAPGRAVGRCDR